jgi:hypothetical protein
MSDRRTEERIDAALADTFPASDPPFFMGSTAVAGSPHGKAPAAERSGAPPANDSRKPAVRQPPKPRR